LAVARFSPVASLTGSDGAFYMEALAGWIGDKDEPFALFVDATGVRGSDAEYRAVTSRFYRLHRDAICIALLNAGPGILVVAEMLRTAVGIQIEVFPDEVSARAWFRTKGISV
jgi:hypothetical protein